MCKTRKTPAFCLAVLSTLVFVCGILIIVMTVGMNSVDNALATSVIQAPEFQMAQDAGSVILWICALLSIIVACAGCAAVKIKHRCYIILYGCCLGSIWIGVLIVGCVFAGTASAAPMITQQLCTPAVDKPQNSYQNGGFGRELNQILNSNMCTAQCPCPQEARVVYDNKTEASMNFFSRTRQAGTGNTTNNMIMMNYQATGSFKNFSDCYTQVLAPQATDAQKKNMNSLLKVMSMMEPKFQCSGICNPGLFWFTQSVTLQPPASNCITYLADAVGTKFTPVGLVSILSGVIMGLIWIFQYALWCKYDD